jgi:hypothetical protein
MEALLSSSQSSLISESVKETAALIHENSEKIPETDTSNDKLPISEDSNMRMPAKLQYEKHEIYLQGMEFSNSESFINRYPIISTWRAISKQNSPDEKLIIGKPDLEYLEKAKSRFLLESLEIMNHRSRLAFYSSSSSFDLKSLRDQESNFNRL